MAKTIKFTVTLSSESERALRNDGCESDDDIRDQMIDLMTDALADYRAEHLDDDDEEDEVEAVNE